MNPWMTAIDIFLKETTLLIFWKQLVNFVDTLKNDDRYRGFLGKENLDAINDYFINIQSKVQSYKKGYRIGNSIEAQREENAALQVAGEMMRELEDILLKESDVEPPNLLFTYL